ncbi:MAG: glycosyltransferase [Gemmatimonadaceae bacterium]
MTPSSPAPDRPIQAHAFWAYGPLSNLERVCVASFHAQGFDVQLWTYGDLPNAPPGITVRDARDILPESAVFLNQAGSYASFSDLFRYATLHRYGGLYADTDVIALQPASALPRTPFLVTERAVPTRQLMRLARRVMGYPIKYPVNNNVIYNPEPAAGNLIDLALAVAERYRKDRIAWGELGPNLLTALTGLTPDHGFTVHAPAFANPLAWWQCPTTLLAPAPLALPAEAHFLHGFNELWRKAGIDKNAPFPAGSPMAQFAVQFGTAHPDVAGTPHTSPSGATVRATAGHRPGQAISGRQAMVSSRSVTSA